MFFLNKNLELLIPVPNYLSWLLFRYFKNTLDENHPREHLCLQIEISVFYKNRAFVVNVEELFNSNTFCEFATSKIFVYYNLSA